jgi:hypothetical protein
MMRRLALALAFLALVIQPASAGFLLNSYRVAAPASGNITIVDTAEAANAIDGGDVTITLSNIAGLAENDVVFVMCGTPRLGSGTAATFSGGGGTSVSGPSENTIIRTQVHRKVMSSSPDTTVVCSGTANASDAIVGVAIALRGVNASTPEDATPTIKNDTASTNPDAISITTATNNAWVLDFASSESNDGAVTVPTGYSNLINTAGSDTRPMSIAVSTIIKATAGAEDPPAYTNWNTARWNAHTVAVRPQ